MTLISRLARLFFVLILVYPLDAAQAEPGENAELASYAQDLYRERGINISRSAFELLEKEDWGRIFVIQIVSRNSTLPDDLLQAFLIGGAISQHARERIDQVVVLAELEFSDAKPTILRATGACCEKLYNNRMSVDNFTNDCLRME